MSEQESARKLHETMLAEPSGTYFSVQEMQAFAGVSNAEQLMSIAQVLLNQQLVKIATKNGEVHFQAVDVQEAARKANMNQDEALVYSYIEASGREGIWTKTIKARTNLHQHVVLRCLKSLEGQRIIKSVKSVKYPTRKIYMLYHLTPSIEVTGGPWFTDGELDSEFVESLLTIIWRFVASRTFHNAFGNGKLKDMPVYSAGYNNCCTVEDILAFIIKSEVTSEELVENDIRSLCQVLVYDDKLEKVELDSYKATLQSLVDLKEEKLEDNWSIFDTHTMGSTNDDLVYFDEYTI